MSLYGKGNSSSVANKVIIKAPEITNLNDIYLFHKLKILLLILFLMLHSLSFLPYNMAIHM
jgi:hypothetical protein